MSYLGSKAASGAREAIIALMPPHQTYIETHLGSGAVMAAKPPAMCNIGIDIDEGALEYAQTHRLQEYHAALELKCTCAHEYLESYPFVGSELVYCDPPYLLETRTSRARYAHEYSKPKHQALLDIIRDLPTQVMISGYPSQLYDQVLEGWHTTSFQVMTRGGVRTEKLWYNFEPNSAHWATCAGANFRQRQHIKRKVKRWARNFASMPAGERRAILSGLLEVESEP